METKTDGEEISWELNHSRGHLVHQRLSGFSPSASESKQLEPVPRVANETLLEAFDPHTSSSLCLGVLKDLEPPNSARR